MINQNGGLYRADSSFQPAVLPCASALSRYEHGGDRPAERNDLMMTTSTARSGR